MVSLSSICVLVACVFLISCKSVSREPSEFDLIEGPPNTYKVRIKYVFANKSHIYGDIGKAIELSSSFGAAYFIPRDSVAFVNGHSRGGDDCRFKIPSQSGRGNSLFGHYFTSEAIIEDPSTGERERLFGELLPVGKNRLIASAYKDNIRKSNEFVGFATGMNESHVLSRANQGRVGSAPSIIPQGHSLYLISKPGNARRRVADIRDFELEGGKVYIFSCTSNLKSEFDDCMKAKGSRKQCDKVQVHFEAFDPL